MEPTIKFSERMSCRKEVGTSGMVPVKLFWRRLKNFILPRLVRPSGIVPVREFEKNLRNVRAVREVKEAGSVPFSEIPFNSILLITSLFEQVIPVKAHLAFSLE
jgi:hypothetical protein